jgi:hypothetical protein
MDLEITKDQFGEDIVDVSKHWGRSVTVEGKQLMAAPLMWFGEKFDLIARDKLLGYKYSQRETINKHEIVRVQHFGVYDDPSKKENREKQKGFWEFFNIEDIVKKFESKVMSLDEWIAHHKAIFKKKKK